jgi:hypothetical protein
VLRNALKDHNLDGSRYAQVVVDTILSFEPQAVIPPWMVDFFYPHALNDVVFSLISYGRLEEAARLVTRLMDENAFRRTAGKPPLADLPITGLDRLMHALTDTTRKQLVQESIQRWTASEQ